MTSRPGPELETIIGTEAFVRLAEAFGGTRLYVPEKIAPGHPIAKAVDIDAARKLSERLAPDVIDVPLAREQRARHYAAQNMTGAEIARRLGMTVGGVRKLLAKVRQAAPVTQEDAVQYRLLD